MYCKKLDCHVNWDIQKKGLPTSAIGKSPQHWHILKAMVIGLPLEFVQSNARRQMWQAKMGEEMQKYRKRESKQTNMHRYIKVEIYRHPQ